jgi:hypothetical protein
MQYKMLSDNFLTRFRTFMSAENGNPAGAFDAMPKAQPRKDSGVKYRYTPLPGTGNSLFLRERSANLAFDEATEITDPAKDVLNFLRNKISDDDMRQVEELLKMEAGVKIDSQKDADAMIAGAEARGRVAQDAKQLAMDASAAASNERMADFARRFPNVSRVGHV